MASYRVKVVVEYDYEVEADSDKEAEEQGYEYEDYKHHASVYSIDIQELEEESV
jgi:hypothetical protein